MICPEFSYKEVQVQTLITNKLNLSHNCSFPTIDCYSVTGESRIIESILLGFPFSPIFTAKLEDGSVALLNHSETLNAIKLFIDQKFALKGLSILKEVEGMKFFDLPESCKDCILKFTFLVAQVDKPVTPKEILDFESAYMEILLGRQIKR